MALERSGICSREEGPERPGGGSRASPPLQPEDGLVFLTVVERTPGHARHRNRARAWGSVALHPLSGCVSAAASHTPPSSGRAPPRARRPAPGLRPPPPSRLMHLTRSSFSREAEDRDREAPGQPRSLPAGGRTPAPPQTDGPRRRRGAGPGLCRPLPSSVVRGGLGGLDGPRFTASDAQAAGGQRSRVRAHSPSVMAGPRGW